MTQAGSDLSLIIVIIMLEARNGEKPLDRSESGHRAQDCRNNLTIIMSCTQAYLLSSKAYITTPLAQAWLRTESRTSHVQGPFK